MWLLMYWHQKVRAYDSGGSDEDGEGDAQDVIPWATLTFTEYEITRQQPLEPMVLEIQ